ncbi:unnamed protein product, partial [Tuber aestivum]
MHKAPVIPGATTRRERKSPPVITKPRLRNLLDIAHTPFLIDEPVAQLLLAVPDKHRSIEKHTNNAKKSGEEKVNPSLSIVRKGANTTFLRCCRDVIR